MKRIEWLVARWRRPMRAQVEQVAYMGGTVQYQVRTHGGLVDHRARTEDRANVTPSEVMSISPGRRTRR